MNKVLIIAPAALEVVAYKCAMEPKVFLKFVWPAGLCPSATDSRPPAPPNLNCSSRCR